jgi:hypothetical protein
VGLQKLVKCNVSMSLIKDLYGVLQALGGNDWGPLYLETVNLIDSGRP